MFECLTGEVPFVRDSEIAVVFAHLEEPPPKASERLPELAARARCGDRPRARQGAGRPAGELWRTGRRGAPRARPGRARRGAGAGVLAALALVAGVLAAGASIAWPCAPVGHRRPRARTGSVVRIDPASGTVTARYRLSAHPAAVAVGPQVWVADFRQGTLWRIDPRTGAINSIPAIGNPRAARDPRRARLRRQRRPVAARGQRHPLRRTHRRAASTDVKVVPCSVAAGVGVAYRRAVPMSSA